MMFLLVVQCCCFHLSSHISLHLQQHFDCISHLHIFIQLSPLQLPKPRHTSKHVYSHYHHFVVLSLHVSSVHHPTHSMPYSERLAGPLHCSVDSSPIRAVQTPSLNHNCIMDNGHDFPSKNLDMIHDKCDCRVALSLFHHFHIHTDILNKMVLHHPNFSQVVPLLPIWIVMTMMHHPHLLLLAAAMMLTQMMIGLLPHHPYPPHSHSHNHPPPHQSSSYYPTYVSQHVTSP
mmetsp:Transcript_8465/g.12723  ORF Transcript_8465/g.12723 Transcript_8465/m.12723 type:complete len:231 (+) Transcript_8465:330-1022(+)